MISIERRLQLGQVVTIACFALLMVFASSYIVKLIIENHVTSGMQHDAEALLGSLRLNDQGVLSLGDQRLTPIYQQAHSGHYFVVQLGQQPIHYSHSLWNFNLAAPMLEPGEQLIQYVPGPSEQSLLMLSAGYLKKDTQVTISIAEDLTELHYQIRWYQLIISAIGALLMVALLFVQRRLLKTGFSYFLLLQTELKEIAKGSEKQLSTDTPAEVAPLVNEINRLLDLSYKRLTRYRNALGNLAHALKMPLNLLQQDIDNSDLPDKQKATLSAHAGRIQQLTERELRRARLAGAVTAGQGFHCEDDIPALIHSLKAMYRDKNLNIQVSPLPKQTLSIDREDMLELIGNLMDNACKWAKSQIKLSIDVHEQIEIALDDDGPGVDSVNLGLLTKRSVRIDEAVSGHGLGLAIVQDIVGLYHGELRLSQSELGGLSVRISLPLPL